VTATTHDIWLAGHRYLQSVADVCALVEAAAARAPGPDSGSPRWEDYLADFHAGVPLIVSERAAIDVGDPVAIVASVLDRLQELPVPASLASRCRALHDDLRSAHEAQPRVEAGLFRVLLWAVLARQLRPVIDAFAQWRDEDRWLRNYCPTCGDPPAMAQLTGQDPGRLRLLSCGSCRTRWRYRRMGCPFCENPDNHRLSVVGVEGERPLRIDFCESCRGYLKTYDGQGSEDVMLADWTSLHLDFIARDRGLQRRARSLYDI
jgi:FdhE protein